MGEGGVSCAYLRNMTGDACFLCVPLNVCEAEAVYHDIGLNLIG
jgi:hypothetical protein